MRKSHSYSPNNKVVAGSPHNFSMPAGGGPGAASGGGMDASGGAAANFCDGGKFADGGGYEHAPSTMDNIVGAVKHVVGADKVPANPKQAGVASGNSDESYEGTGGANRNATIDTAVKDNGG